MKFGIKSLLLAVALILGGSSWAQAITAGGGGGSPTVEQFNQLTGLPEWNIGSTGSPIQITLDPNAGAWIKQLNTDQVTATENGPHFDLLETVQIVGPPWEDWHEQILTPGWEWAGVWRTRIFNGTGFDPIPGLVIDTSDPTLASLTFDPLPAGTILDLGKDLVFVGVIPSNPNETFNGVLEIAQWPTPEPTTASVLLLMGGLTLLRRRSA